MRFTSGDVRDYIVSSKIDRISVVALKSDAAAEKSNDQLSPKYLPGSWGFDFLRQLLPTTKVATNSITSSAGEQGLRNGEAERLCSGEVDDRSWGPHSPPILLWRPI